MGIREVIQRFGEGNKIRKAKIKEIDENIRLSKLVQDRMKSANERELERYQNEDREKDIKEALEYMRKKRQNDINFGHNPLDTPNITSTTSWEVLKEKNLFKGGKQNMFMCGGSVLKNNNNLFKNNMRLMR